MPTALFPKQVWGGVVMSVHRDKRQASGCFGCLVFVLAIFVIDTVALYGAYRLADWFFTTFFG